MSYTASDPRSTLATAPAPAKRLAVPNVAPQYFEFGELEPNETHEGGGRSWWSRSQAIVSCYTEAAAGDVLQPDEYVVLLTDDSLRVVVSAGGQDETIDGRALVIVPPGDSSIRIDGGGRVVRLFSSQSGDLAAKSRNADFYAEPDPHVADWSPWPDPPDGHRIRVYAIDDVEPAPGRFGRIYRCSTFMINWFYDSPGPRPENQMSPHHHDDFEQLSLQLGGDYVHHIRTPWTPDMTTWREDEHRFCTSPSITVIPPPSVHTSQAVGDTSHFLVDIFAPPRFDFSEKEGWVLNADEYPMPTS
jgi:hypothetical protein